MTTLLLIDTETTGLDDDAQVIELAATLYRVGQPSGAIASASTLIQVSSNPAQSVNGIDPALTDWESGGMMRAIRSLAQSADWLLAFNAEFDRARFETAADHSGSWICARNDIDWLPGWIDRPRSQIDLALSMGVGVLHAHRAGDDVRTLVACLDRLGDRCPSVIDEAIERVSSPRLHAIAVKPPEQKQVLRDAGFWRNDRWEWVRDLWEYDAARLSAQWSFPVRLLAPEQRAARESSPVIEVAAKVGYDDRQLAKDLYFRWDSDRRAWVKEIRQYDYANNLWDYPFEIAAL